MFFFVIVLPLGNNEIVKKVGTQVVIVNSKMGIIFHCPIFQHKTYAENIKKI